MSRLRQAWNVLRGKDVVDFGNQPRPGQRVRIGDTIYIVTSFSIRNEPPSQEVEINLLTFTSYQDAHRIDWGQT